MRVCVCMSVCDYELLKILINACLKQKAKRLTDTETIRIYGHCVHLSVEQLRPKRMQDLWNSWPIAELLDSLSEQKTFLPIIRRQSMRSKILKLSIYLSIYQSLGGKAKMTQSHSANLNSSSARTSWASYFTSCIRII